MRTLARPAFTVEHCVTLCADSIQDKALSMRLLGELDTFKAAELDYLSKGPGAQLYLIEESLGVGDWIDGPEMTHLYDRTFVRKTGPTRHIYNLLKLSAIGGICPLCNQRVVSTLDHQLAKAHHPALTITPINMVPACKDCNSDTVVRRATSQEEQTLHPYFDAADHDIWLEATLIQETPPALVFSANPPSTWTPMLRAMVASHFHVFGLGTLYSVHAAGELVNVSHDVCMNAMHMDSLTIQSHLRQQAANRRFVQKNSWQGAMYQALADSNWFCGGGYNNVIQNSLDPNP